MALSYTLKDDAGGKLTLVGTQVRAASALATGTLNYVVTATDSNGWTKDYAGTVTVATALAVAYTPPRAVAGIAYTYLPTVTGGSGTKVFALTGTLLPGLVFDTATGEIRGTATQAGTVNVTVNVTDATTSTPVTASFSLTVESIMLPTARAFAVDTAPANNTALGTVIPLRQPYQAQTTWTMTGQTEGLAINSTTGAITVADGTKLNYASAKTRLITITATDQYSSSKCTAVVNLRSGWYRQPLASPVKRPVANRCRQLQGVSPTGMKEGKYRIVHDVFAWQVENGFTLTYVNRRNELTSPGAITVSARVEIPAFSGNWTDLTFGGAASVTIPVNGTDVNTDALAVTIDASTMIRTETYVRGDSGWPVLDQFELRKQRGEGGVASATSLSGVSVTDGDLTHAYGPSGIFGLSRAPVAWVLFGDSLLNGIAYNGDERLASYAEYVLHGRMPYINVSTYGENAYNVRLNHTRRMEFIRNAGVNRALLGFGNNDVASTPGTTYGVSTIRDNDMIISSMLYYMGIEVTLTTLLTRTDSTNQWLDQEGQTPRTRFVVGGDADIVNAARLTGTQFVAKCIDIRPGFQNAQNKILTDGVTPNRTTPYNDGTHYTSLGAVNMAAPIDPDALANSAVFVPAVPQTALDKFVFMNPETLRGTVADGAQVTSWADTKAAMTATVAAGTTAPTFVANGPKGKASVKAVSASNQRMVIPAAQATPLADLFKDAGMFIMVFKSTSSGAATYGTMASKGNAAASRTNFGRHGASGSTIQMGMGRSTTAFSAQIANLPLNEWHTVIFRADEADFTQARYWGNNFFGNNALVNPSGSGTKSSDAANDLILFNSSDFNRGYDGELALIGWATVPPGDLETNEVYAYIREMYGTING